MKVVIDPKVYDTLKEFYVVSCRVHFSLEYSTCVAKMKRLERAMFDFSNYAEILHKTPYREDWRAMGYYEFVTEDFHFAYRVYKLPNGEKVLRYHDAVHSLLNYNPEDK